MLDHGPPAPDWSVHRDHNAGHSIKRVWASDPQSKILSESSLYRESHGIVIKTSRMSWYDGTLACLRFSTKPFTMPRWSKNSHVQVLSFLFLSFSIAEPTNTIIWSGQCQGHDEDWEKCAAPTTRDFGKGGRLMWSATILAKWHAWAPQEIMEALTGFHPCGLLQIRKINKKIKTWWGGRLFHDSSTHLLSAAGNQFLHIVSQYLVIQLFETLQGPLFVPLRCSV